MRWCEQRRHTVGIGGEQLSLPPVCALEQLAVRQTADQAGVNDTGPTNARNVTRTRIDPVVIPDRLARLRIVVDEKSAAVLLGKDAGEPPGRIREITDVEKVDDHQVTGFGSVDPERSAQIMDFCQVDVADVVSAVVGSNLSARPVEAFDPEFRPRFIRFH